jgi:hypothetical protein
MTVILTLTICAVLTSEDPARSKDKEERKPNPLAPSLPLLTDEEEDKLDAVIDRFILQDTGKLRGAEGKKALTEFNKLGPEAIPALIRGINRAARINDSCPALVIAKKLHRMLSASEDQELLQFARENIGAGIKQSRHLETLDNLRMFCAQRKNLIARKAAGGHKTAKAPIAMSVAELTSAAGSDRGERLRAVLTELEKRPGDEVIGALGSAAADYEKDIQQLARELLYKHLSRQKEAIIKAKLQDDRREVRAAAARVAGEKKMPLGDGLINLLTDDESAVRDAAHQALIRLNKGTDLGPKPKASDAEVSQAVQRWRAWWSKQDGK